MQRQAQFQAAADSLNRAISLNPRSSSYYYVLSGIYRRLGNLEESKKALTPSEKALMIVIAPVVAVVYLLAFPFWVLEYLSGIKC